MAELIFSLRQIAADGEATTDARVKAAFFIVEPNRDQLTKISALLDAGKLRAFVDAEVSLAQAPAAYADAVLRRNGYGKVVVLTRAGEARVGPGGQLISQLSR